MKIQSRTTGRRDGGRSSQQQEGPQLDVRIIQSRKVFKVTSGGKTASWSVLVVVGDNKGKIGLGLGKARGIPDAIRKGEEIAKRSMIKIPMILDTIPHRVNGLSGSAQVLLRPAAAGTGVKAGSAIRACLEAGGVKNIIAKSLGSRNAINMAYATIKAIQSICVPEEVAARRSLNVSELMPWLAKARKEEADAAR